MAISNSLGHKGSQTQFYHCEVCEYVFPTFPFLNPSIEGWVYNIAKICPSFKPIRYIIHFKIRSSNIRNNYKKKSPGVDYESYFWQLSDALISTDVKWSQHLVWTLASFFSSLCKHCTLPCDRIYSCDWGAKPININQVHTLIRDSDLVKLLRSIVESTWKVSMSWTSSISCRLVGKWRSVMFHDIVTRIFAVVRYTETWNTSRSIIDGRWRFVVYNKILTS